MGLCLGPVLHRDRGAHLEQLPWKPRFGALYYFGSGDDDPTDDRNNTFSVLFPLGHGY